MLDGVTSRDDLHFRVLVSVIDRGSGSDLKDPVMRRRMVGFFSSSAYFLVTASLLHVRCLLPSLSHMPQPEQADIDAEVVPTTNRLGMVFESPRC
jgi:hypothetical protein